MSVTASETKSKYPVAIFELLPKGSGSGFIREDTVRSATPIEIIHPKNRVVINRSVVRKESVDGKGNKVFVNVPTRYIYGSQLIYEKDQKLEGLMPNPKVDRIEFKNGLLTVPKDGATVGLYEFMTSHAQNVSNEGRKGLEHLEPIFKEIKPAENAQELNMNEFLMAEAVTYVRSLMTEKGNKGYIFAEERIDALCNLFNVQSETYEQKVSSLLYYAKTNPKHFLIEAKKSEQIAVIEVQHGLKLKVIVFEGNTCLYVNRQEKIKTFAGNLSDEKKINALANFFKSVDGAQSYEIFKAELGAAKEAALSQQ